MEMSITTTSGFSSSALRTAASPSLASATTVMSGLAVDHQLQAVAHGDVIVGEKHAQPTWRLSGMVDHLAGPGGTAIRTRMVVPLPGVDSISRLAPTSAARSCMPTSP